MEKAPFWQKTWFLALMFLVVPPLGIVLMWGGKKEWNKVIKIVFSVIFGLYSLLWSLILIGLAAGEDTSASSPAETTAYSESTEKNTTIIFETPTREESATEATTENEEPTTVVSATKEETTTESATTKAPSTNSSVVIKPVVTTKKVTTTAKPNTTVKPATQSSSTEYVLNTNTMRFHKPDCHSVKEIYPENKEIVKSNRNAIISQGFKPCGNCHP